MPLSISINLNITGTITIGQVGEDEGDGAQTLQLGGETIQLGGQDLTLTE